MVEASNKDTDEISVLIEEVNSFSLFLLSKKLNLVVYLFRWIYRRRNILKLKTGLKA